MRGIVLPPAAAAIRGHCGSGCGGLRIPVIDLHCHLLPGVDDGALDLADSLAMARQAEADGISAICATPHIRHDHDVRIGELHARVAELNRALEAAASAA
jgi:tyrosine-protein phosphatase YwqE